MKAFHCDKEVTVAQTERLYTRFRCDGKTEVTLPPSGRNGVLILSLKSRYIKFEIL